MEKAMQKSHGMSYAEYGRKLDNRLMVEEKREKSYRESMRMAAAHQRKAHH
ncbi:hypothetical protein [Bacillus sp. FJAT-42376]|uniref:hypothetical protein n=1 Tax=Bacillus sp. FJAT-42376 TaxID=2014076 RepID=UPI0013DDACE3|nr:hypothetical protein [Bacillus sp. FJAT-42376]